MSPPRGVGARIESDWRMQDPPEAAKGLLGAFAVEPAA